MSALLGLLLLMPPQTPPGVPGSEGRAALFGSVAERASSAEELPLSLSDAIQRGLVHNLGALLAAQGVRAAEGDRWEKLSDLLPHLSAHLAATRQKINLEAFGFSGFPGLPVLVGPFNVVDARAVVSQAVIDLEALNKVRADDERLAAARYSYQDTRDLVALVCGNLYLQVLAEEARIKAAQAQVDTARALHELAADRKAAGLAPAVDALRAEVELKAREQQLIVAQNRLARARLSLARAIGLPLGQSFRLTDRVAYAPPPPSSRARPKAAAAARPPTSMVWKALFMKFAPVRRPFTPPKIIRARSVTPTETPSAVATRPVAMYGASGISPPAT